MPMPEHVVEVRHSTSEGNRAARAAKEGDLRYYTDEYRARLDIDWRATEQGVEDAQVTGAWITKHIIEEDDLTDGRNNIGFDLHMVTPYLRGRETAGNLWLPNAKLRINRQLREREHGLVSSLTRQEFAEQYPDYFDWLQKDPIHGKPPGGESIAEVAENRVREVLDTLHRAHDEKGAQSAILVAHGEYMWASALVLDYMFDVDYMESHNDASQKMHNNQVKHRTRVNPENGELAPYLRWWRSVCPPIDGDVPGEWKESGRILLSNEGLLEQVEATPRLVYPSTDSK